MARASWAYPPMATGTTAVAAADAPDRGCASPSPEGVAEVEPLVTHTHLLPLCRDEHAVLWERVNDPVGPGDQLAEILADVRAVLPVASSVTVLNPEARCALAGALTASRGCSRCWWPTPWPRSSTGGSRTVSRGPSAAAAPIDPVWATQSRSTAPTHVRSPCCRGPPRRGGSLTVWMRPACSAGRRAGVDVIAEIRAMAASSPLIDEQSLNHTRATTGRRTTTGEDQSWTEAV